MLAAALPAVIGRGQARHESAGCGGACQHTSAPRSHRKPGPLALVQGVPLLTSSLVHLCLPLQEPLAAPPASLVGKRPDPELLDQPLRVPPRCVLVEDCPGLVARVPPNDASNRDRVGVVGVLLVAARVTA